MQEESYVLIWSDPESDKSGVKGAAQRTFGPDPRDAAGLEFPEWARDPNSIGV